MSSSGQLDDHQRRGLTFGELVANSPEGHTRHQTLLVWALQDEIRRGRIDYDGASYALNRQAFDPDLLDSLVRLNTLE
jgi:hypothetical protein